MGYPSGRERGVPSGCDAGLSLKADVFNVFDRQIVQNVEERWNNGNGPRSTYGPC